MTVNIAIPAELTQQATELTAKIATIDSDLAILNEQRQAAVDGLSRVEHVIRILKGESEPVQAATPGTRKPMSAEARQRIADGLRASAQRKRDVFAAAAQAAAQPSVPTAPASVAPVVADPTPAPAKPVARKK